MKTIIKYVFLTLSIISMFIWAGTGVALLMASAQEYITVNLLAFAVAFGGGMIFDKIEG